MIMWLLLVSLFCKSSQDGNGQENGVLHCGPQNLTLTSSDQTILLKWEDDSSCSAAHDTLTYELQVFKADKQVHNDEVTVTPDWIGSTHSWNWTSPLPLECISHSVRLRSGYKNHRSPWIEQTLPGKESFINPEVYPRDKYFEVGSTATFCCVLPDGDIFEQMYLSPHPDTSRNNISMINNQTYVLTVHLDQPSGQSSTDVRCTARDQHGKTRENGASSFIGYKPGDKDLQCETRDLQSVECHWTAGRNSKLLQLQTEYQLLERPCACGSEGKCSQKVPVDVGERNWTLRAKNTFGELELSDMADLMKRVYMFAPEGVTASTVNARNVSLEWRWTVKEYNNLNITCQVNVSHGGTNTMRENVRVGLKFTVLTDLIPLWTYDVTVRCSTTQHFWKWSDWSTTFSFSTEDDVPDAPDVWMQMRYNETIIIWKMLLDNQIREQINYTVTWAKSTETERPNRTTVVSTELPLSLDTTKEYTVTVTARNIKGSSPPSTITVPCFNPDTPRVNTSWITGSNGSFSLSWSASPTATCGYIVEWYPTSSPDTVEWLKVPPHETKASIFSEKFKDGLRYLLSIHACTMGAPVLLERREGYVSEKKIQDGLFKTESKQWDSNVMVYWAPVSLTDQTAVIKGYVLYWTEKDNNNMVFNVSTDIPGATNLTATNLNISSYRFTVKAKTAVGECGITDLYVTLHSLTADNVIKTVFVSLATVFCLLSLITVICYKNWACIKQKVYPPIPKPLLTGWLTSPGEHTCRPLHLDQCHYSEADIMDIPELHCKPALENGYVSNENMPFVFAQTPKGYLNQPLKKYTPPQILPTTTTPSQPGLLSSSFKGVFPNLSYNLVMQTRDQQSHSVPELQEVTQLNKNSSGYQPQSHTQTFTLNQTEGDPGSPMPCVTTYILLPQSVSK